MLKLTCWRLLRAALGAAMCLSAAALGWCQEASVEMPLAPFPPAERAGPRDIRDRIVMGRVTDLNPVRGYIELESFPAGTSRVIVVTDKTQITKPGTITAAELHVGDVVRVSGIHLQLEAASVSVQPPREAPEDEGGAPGEASSEAGEAVAGENEESEDPEPRPDEAAAPDEERGRLAEGRGPPRRAEGTVSVSGVVKSLDPLVVALSDELSITVTLTDQTVISKPVPGTIEDVNEGDFLWASGERNADDLLEAAQARIIPAEEAMSRFSRFPSALGDRPEERRRFGRPRGEFGRGDGAPPFGEGRRRERGDMR